MVILVRLDPETGMYEGSCTIPPVASFGATLKEAVAMTQEAAMCYLEADREIRKMIGPFCTDCGEFV